MPTQTFKKLFSSKLKILRAFQLLGNAVSVIGLVYYCYGIILKYFFDPEISVSEFYRQSSEIPFPGVTICSPVVFRRNLIDLENFYQLAMINGTIQKLSVSEQNFLAAKAQICSFPNNHPEYDQGTRDRSERNIVKLLIEGAPNVEETFPRCGQSYKLSSCSLMASRSLTELGMCYTFNRQSYDTIFNKGVVSSDFDVYKAPNYRHFDEIWSLDRGYISDDDLRVPYRSSLGQIFHFIMGVNLTDLKNLCFHLKSSFKIFLHLPNEIPTNFHESDFINFETRMTLQVTATASDFDKRLKIYSPEKRRCYFESERNLQFFKAYTRVHCNFECLTNFTLKRCGCVPFYFPRIEDTKICDLHEVACYKQAHSDWPRYDEMSNTSALPCNCLPTCSNIEYRIKSKQVTKIKENSSSTIKEISAKDNITRVYAALNVEFADFLIKESSNNVSYTLANFIADCGGLLGLFLGFSFIGMISFVRRMIELQIKQEKTSNVEAFVRPEIIIEDSENKKRSSWRLDIDNEKDIEILEKWQKNAHQKLFLRT